MDYKIFSQQHHDLFITITYLDNTSTTFAIHLNIISPSWFVNLNSAPHLSGWCFITSILWIRRASFGLSTTLQIMILIVRLIVKFAGSIADLVGEILCYSSADVNCLFRVLPMLSVLGQWSLPSFLGSSSLAPSKFLLSNLILSFNILTHSVLSLENPSQWFKQPLRPAPLISNIKSSARESMIVLSRHPLFLLPLSTAINSFWVLCWAHPFYSSENQKLSISPRTLYFWKTSKYFWFYH